MSCNKTYNETADLEIINGRIQFTKRVYNGMIAIPNNSDIADGAIFEGPVFIGKNCFFGNKVTLKNVKFIRHCTFKDGCVLINCNNIHACAFGKNTEVIGLIDRLGPTPVITDCTFGKWSRIENTIMTNCKFDNCKAIINSTIVDI